MSNSVLLKFRLWRKADKVSFQILEQDESLRNIEEDEEPTLAPKAPLPVLSYSRPELAENYVYVRGMENRFDLDVWERLARPAPESYIRLVLDSLAYLGTPDYGIADNTDPDKVFTVYAREEK
jgi:hypothetical protein